MKHQSIYDEVTNLIVAALEQGTAPWLYPWNQKEAIKYGGNARLPFNASTGRPYSGINVVLLWMCAPAGGFMTYRQAEKLGGQVRAGSKGYRVVFADHHTKTKRDDAGNLVDESYYFLKRYTVFHVSQIDGLPAKYYATPETLEYGRLSDESFNAWVASVGADIRPGGVRAYYSPSGDYIGMPPVQTFKSADDYKSTMLHELGHWTGHKKRLERGFGWSDELYAREELVAEMSSAFSCARHGIVAKLQHAEYIATWIKGLKSDNKAIFKAASAAQKATELLFQLAERPIAADHALVPYVAHLPMKLAA